MDNTQTSTLSFKGYEAEQFTSEITGLPRLKYNRDKPFTKQTIYQDYFYPMDTVDVPAAYIVKRSWKKVSKVVPKIADNIKRVLKNRRNI